MKKLPFIALILIFSFAFWGCRSNPAVQQQQPEVLPSITIVNNTGYPVKFIHISLVTESDFDFSDNWLLRNQELASGQSVPLQLRYLISDQSYYDILLADSDGDSYQKARVPVTDGARIVFTMDDWSARNIFYD